MPLDVRGCTRATLSGSACVYPSPRGVGNPLNPTRDRDWGLQLFPMNEEFPCGAAAPPWPSAVRLRVPDSPASSGGRREGFNASSPRCGSGRSGTERPEAVSAAFVPLSADVSGCPVRLARATWSSLLSVGANSLFPPLTSGSSGPGVGRPVGLASVRARLPVDFQSPRCPRSAWGLPRAGVVWGERGCRRRLGWLPGKPASNAAAEHQTQGKAVSLSLRRASVPRGRATKCRPPGRLHIRLRPQIRRDNPLNLSILLSGGKETNQDSLSSGERRGKSPAPNPRPTGGLGKCGVWKTACPVSLGGLSPSDRGSAHGRCEAGNGPRRAGVRSSRRKVEKNFEERVQEGVKPLRGKRVGSAQSARGIQLGGSGSAARCGRISSWDLSRRWLAPAGRISSAAVRRDRLWVGLERLGAKVARDFGRVLYSALRPDLAASRGRGQSARCALSPPRGRDGAPCSRCDCQPGRTVLSALRPRRAVRAGIGSRKRRQGSAAMSATHPTRLETRTKESNARASQRVHSKPRGAMKVRAGARRLRWDPGPSGLGAPPARLARTVGEVERERAPDADAHQTPEKVLVDIDSRTVAMEVGIR
ncbi:hypothetical protein NQZ68_040717 [Dissostichus eleginoides]|nr:hypothetical protein NQZ68_040717 [Dissostichus eleginoides]